MILFATASRSWISTVLKESPVHKIPLFLVLSLGCAPAALAFPPCPQFPVDLTPIDGPARVQRAMAPWFSAAFTLQGHPEILDRIAPPGSLGSDIIHSGKCRRTDRLPVLSDHAGHDANGAIPTLAPDGGFGTIGLPDLRLSDPGMTLVYTLSFSVDAAPLAAAADWFDLAELELRRADVVDDGSLETNSTLYRLRKRMRADGTAQLALLESERLPHIRPPGSATSRTVSPAVATLPMGPGGTGLSMRWYQRTRPLLPAYSLPPVIPGPPRDELHGASLASATGRDAWVLPSTVDTIVEMTDANGRVLFQRTLHDQWVASLSMGLINYNTGSSEKYVWIGGPVIDGMTLEARLDPLPGSLFDATAPLAQ